MKQIKEGGSDPLRHSEDEAGKGMIAQQDDMNGIVGQIRNILPKQ